jgi:hypothetical protein
MELSEDSLLKPFRQMGGQPAPGEDMGGWYHYQPGDLPEDGSGFAPAAPFGQWVSALARMSAILNSQPTRDKVMRLNRLYAQTISGDFYHNNRFPTYCYDKLGCGLIDSRRLAGDRDAFAILEQTTDTALPHFPGHAIEHGIEWRTDHHGDDYTWDESYTISENLFAHSGAGTLSQTAAIPRRCLLRPAGARRKQSQRTSRLQPRQLVEFRNAGLPDVRQR